MGSGDRTVQYRTGKSNGRQKYDNFQMAGHSSGTDGRMASMRFLPGVYVFIALALGEYRAIDRPADPKGKLQLTVF